MCKNTSLTCKLPISALTPNFLWIDSISCKQLYESKPFDLGIVPSDHTQEERYI